MKDRPGLEIGRCTNYNIGMRNKNCDSCMMPLEKDPGPHESDRYCSYCFRGGKFTYEGNDRREFATDLRGDGTRRQGQDHVLDTFQNGAVRSALEEIGTTKIS